MATAFCFLIDYEVNQITIVEKSYLFLEIINEIPPIFKPEKGVRFK